ncbi:hypothetical protein CPLU01_04089 [Colletotrichum plurivorum]|uniref:Uncharacterized protein n=1 Tax=Colletotrichum plurivorum TaxID=2175906 RepID=A0A8H6KQH9_9PEZI|nr:hypothetical protein CPLU01_04089 [Colletotrichum plurivorum]
MVVGTPSSNSMSMVVWQSASTNGASRLARDAAFPDGGSDIREVVRSTVVSRSSVERAKTTDRRNAEPASRNGSG